MYRVEMKKLSRCMELIPNKFKDYRGESIKTFHTTSLKELGIIENFREDLVVVSHKNVFRGMHFQKPPFAQSKIVYCIKGKILDIVLDIRKDSPTYGIYETIELDGKTKNMLYIPEGFAHGYISLEEESIMFYKMSNEYHKEVEDGISWDSIGLDLDIKDMIISQRDREFQSLEEFESPF